MLIRPELRALRGDDAPQRLAQAAIAAVHAAWQDGAGAAVTAQLASFAACAGLAELPALAALFGADGDPARRFTAGLLGPLLDALAGNPLAEVPLRHAADAAHATLVLARAGEAALTVTMIDGAGLARQPEARSARFAPVETWERVLAGTAVASEARLSERSPGQPGLEIEELRLECGAVRHRWGARTALVLRQVPGSLVMLRLQRRSADAPVAREYALADGTLLHQASANPQDSRIELAAALLRRMERRDAAPLLARIAAGPGTPAHRWQALRECLALDPATGFAALTALARQPGEPLAQPAAALRQRLLETHPQLESVPCPA